MNPTLGIIVGCLLVLAQLGGSSEEGRQAYAEARKHFLGSGCTIDEKKAKALTFKAADLGDPKAKAVVSFWLFSGERGLVKNESQGRADFQEVIPALRRLKTEGDEEAAFLLADGDLLMAPKPTDGLGPLKELAIIGNQDAMVALARAYRTGRGTETNLWESLFWARKAAEKKHPQAMYLAGLMLLEGSGTRPDSFTGIDWIQQAAERGLPGAQNLLGELYCQGKHLPFDLTKSSDWLLRAAEQDYVKASRHLAQHYADGKGVPPDLSQAKRWLIAAEALGGKGDVELKEKIEKGLEEKRSQESKGHSAKSEEDAFYGLPWLIAGPFDFPAGDPQEFFKSFGYAQFPKEIAEGKMVRYGNMSRTVKKVNAKPKGFSFDKILGSRSNCFAVAFLRIDVEKIGQRLISVGSDDAVKIWLNGKEIHQEWIARSNQPDDDFLFAEFQEGKNEISVMVQNFGGPWGFAIEVPNFKGLNQKLRSAVLQGDTDRVRTLLVAGADPNDDCLYGILNHTETARFMRRQHLSKILQEHGGKIRWYHPIWHPWLTSWILPWLAKLDSRSLPGLSLLVTREGKTLIELCWGMAHVETSTKITPETKFPIGSVTKQFTAAAVLRLQEEGKLSLTNSLSKYFPSFPRADKILLRQLLDHTSGIFNYTSQEDFSTRSLTATTGNDVLQYIQNWPLGDYPGRRYEYSNSNHYLAGLVVEKVSGLSLGEYFTKEFFHPLGMKNTVLGEGELLIPEMAAAYSGNPGQIKRANTWNFDWAAGAGGIVSTPRDINIWMEALFGGKVLRPDSLNEMLRVAPTTVSVFPANRDGYACGVFVSHEGGSTRISHTGYLPPYQASATRIQEMKVNVIILTNADGGFEYLNTDWLQEGLLSFFFGPELGPSQRDLEGIAPSQEEIEQLTGVYDDGVSIFNLRYQNNRWIFSGHQGSERLRYLGNQKWACRDCGKLIRAIRKVSDGMRGLEIISGMESRFAVKKTEWDPGAIASLARLPDYLGKFEFERGLGFLDIKFEQGRLVGEWSSNQHQVALESIAPDEFTSPGGQVRLMFERGPGGEVSRLINRYAGYTWELSKKVPNDYPNHKAEGRK